MYTKEQFKEIFKKKFDINFWKNTFLNSFFGATEIRSEEMGESIPSSSETESGYYLGKLQTEDALLGFFYYKINEGSVVHRRVGLRNLVKQFINPRWGIFDAAIVVFDDGENWRLSLVCNIKDNETKATKRFTFVFGEGEQTYHTAVERFELLQKDTVTLKNLIDAFSVEKLSKAFFADYKQHYQHFCDYLINIPGYYLSFFNGKDKAVRDFTKKFLGRIVFLYFLQKKGWLGASDKTYKNGDKNFLTNLFKKSGETNIFYSKWLQPLFFETLNKIRPDDNFTMPDNTIVKIPFLNGGLFEKENPKYDLIDFPKELLTNLFSFFDQYNFTIYEDDPNDHTIAVDPEMLGHIFENLLEDNKDKGAYYTPKEIVHYMCQESLIEYLVTWFEGKGYTIYAKFGSEQPELFPVNEGVKGQLSFENNITTNNQISRDIIENLIKKQLDEKDTDLVKQHATEFHDALEKVKICDPAIGSGAFPMGLLKEIFSTKQTLHLFEYGSLETFRASEVKLNIIQNSIYGVDIEKGAVDIARLRFWLSLIIDEELPKPLPNLDYKIVEGNSLASKFEDEVITIDWEKKSSVGLADTHIRNLQTNLGKLTQKQKQFFQTNNHIEKNRLKNEIRLLKIEILINQITYNKLSYTNKNKKSDLLYGLTPKEQKRNLEIDLAEAGFNNNIQKLQNLKNHPEQPLRFFDWKLDFPEVMNPMLIEENGRIISTTGIGFDIVIGNPPYVDYRKIDETITKSNTLPINFKTSRPNLYQYFIEKGLALGRY